MRNWQDKIKEIIYLLENSSVNEIDVTFWGRRFRVVKSPGLVSGSVAPAPQTINAASAPADIAAGESSEESAGESVLSPMPGTFYRSPSPDEPPFVQEGDQVVKGDTLCIIEAMKIMNEIESEINGVVKKVLVENGTPVEYNQPLFLIEVTGR